MSAITAVIKRPVEWAWFGLLAAAMLAGAVAVGFVIAKGHGQVFNLTREIPWGILISTYVFFVVSSTGLCLVSSLGDVWGFKEFEVIGRRGHLLAILTLVTGFGVMAMELNHPFRMALYAIISPNLSSPIWWMGTLYGVYLILLCGEFTALMIGSRRLSFVFGLLGFFAAISAHSNLGAVFGLLEARHYWYGSFLPIYFILSALVSGGALTALIVYFNHRARGIPLSADYQRFMLTVGRLQALFLGILMFFIIWKIIPGVYGQPPEKYEATMALVSGPLAFNFWFFEVLVGMVIPFLLLVNRRTLTPFGVTVAGLLCTAGIFFMRYDLVIAGQIVPMRESAGEGPVRLLQYFPSLAEMAIVAAAVAFCLFLYTLAEKFLPMEGGHRH